MRAPATRDRKPAATPAAAPDPAAKTTPKRGAGAASKAASKARSAADAEPAHAQPVDTAAPAFDFALPEPEPEQAYEPEPDRFPDTSLSGIPRSLAASAAAIPLTSQALDACFYSSALDGDMSRILGVPHYSYRFAEAKFLHVFAEAATPLVKLAMPEYYSTEWSLPGATAAGLSSIVHLIFRSTEQIRLLKLATNIACFAWEFEVLKDDTRPNEHPFLNQKRMLSLCDEIWVPCTHTRDVLAAHGLDAVHVIPAPIVVPDAPRIDRTEALIAIGHINVMPFIYNFLLPRDQNAAACAAGAQSVIDWLAPRFAAGGDPLVYLAVLNPEDFRKNLDSLLRGFHYFQQAHKGVCLIVKLLTSTERYSLEQAISDVVPNKLASGSVFDTDNIVFMNRYLTDAEMSVLYSLADYYLCTSVAEGQNLPLLEAMAHGTIPVSTANTAMADYISPANAFLIHEELVPNINEHMAGTATGKPFRIHSNTARDVFAALVQSRRATAGKRRQMSAACVQTVRATCGVDVVWGRIAARLDAIRAARAAAAPLPHEPALENA